MNPNEIQSILTNYKTTFPPTELSDSIKSIAHRILGHTDIVLWNGKQVGKVDAMQLDRSLFDEISIKRNLLGGYSDENQSYFIFKLIYGWKNLFFCLLLF